MNKTQVYKQAIAVSKKNPNSTVIVYSNDWGEWWYYIEPSYKSGEIIAVIKNGVDTSD